MENKEPMEIKEPNRVILSGKGILTATRKGTRKFKDGKLVDPGEVVAQIETPNIICNEGLILMAGFAIDESAVYDVGITYCEIGTNNTAPAAGDTSLTAFYHRNPITSRTRTDYADTLATFFTAAESTAFIKEAGCWGGSNAAAGEATGLLFAHWLASFDNSLGVYDITITYILTIARG